MSELEFGDTRDSPKVICGDRAKMPGRQYSTVCVAPPGHTDLHLDGDGRTWSRNSKGHLNLDQPTRVSVARLQAIGYVEWHKKALAQLVHREAVVKASRAVRRRSG